MFPEIPGRSLYLQIMKWLLSLILALGNTVAFSHAAAQADHHSWKRLSFISAVLNERSYNITINSKPASYDTLLRIADSNLVSVQLIRPVKKKKLVTSPGIIRVTTYEKEPFTGTTYYTPDSSRYYIKDADTIFFKLAKEARLYPEDATASQSWRRFLQKKLRGDVPAENGAPEGIYIVYVAFSINPDGSITDVSFETDPGFGTVQEVQSVLRSSPAWQPGFYNGRPVKMRFLQKVTFALSEE